MEVAEIKVSYSNTNLERIKVTNSQILYSLVLKQWNQDLIEFQEEVKIILLNRAQIVLGIYELSKGGVSGTVVDIKIILGIALKCNASSIVIVHNHPSGSLEPSQPDKLITQRLKEASKILDLNLLDHLIITKEGYYSFSDNGIL
ncbi:RadC-like JAB domain-containing protein [Flavobacterium sp. 103]|uniref:JAB domain-containing protein n=1 Tax=Flavobacterium sp. 103 TaxID=2135624 RepID=UPI000D5D1E75|nr:JAB domain-containing protein [Flavobacterium sp. 103]PVX46167.1 RadC-like JAB domain-containing protein [Flavobacterium sp. 103]